MVTTARAATSLSSIRQGLNRIGRHSLFSPSALVQICALIIIAVLLLPAAHAGDGKILAAPGVTQIEGSAGGGLTPWAVLAGYASRDDIAGSVFSSRVGVDDYRLDIWGGALNFYDRVEISIAHQKFDLKQAGAEIRQDIYGAKVRLYGDLIYSDWPQVSAGFQYKRLQDNAIAKAVGAADADHGTDFYLAASKLQLGAVGGYNLLWSLGVRATKANQLGLLGFGGDQRDRYSPQIEAAVAVLLNAHFAVGAEYRQKPDNLGFAKEEDWRDIFIAYFPNKHVNLTLAWVDLGDIAGQDNQRGAYLSLTGYLW
ncbi:conserved hypothetical protein [Hahella chejuensis KCTC 2396]|uniref:DUF3034 family protein n=1 Tax=Hahella chejuensis (strain KCTC 2396) TaxID=349521 RepID=Q2SM39_HAHCH|nr:DUF3034 family protein [Hahella chejuensis]ABC28285.1 conserved hypothetical protein [Hahella chejuensis KCTC 2396]